MNVLERNILKPDDAHSVTNYGQLTVTFPQTSNN